MNKGVELVNVEKKIKRTPIIENLSFFSNRGEILGLLGPNGAGKTTIIKMIAGLSHISSGDIYIAGYSIRHEKMEALKQLGAVVETPAHYESMSGYQNLRYFAKLRKGIQESRILEVVKLMKLEDAIHKKVKTYSLGMKQRLGLAQAILHEPAVLILDEPTNGLDPMGIKDLRNYIQELSEKMNVSVIVSSHLLSEMEMLCDRVIVLKKGRMVQERTLQKHAFAADSPDVNSLEFYVSDAVRSAEIIKNTFSGKRISVNSTHRFYCWLSNEEVALAVQKFIEQEVKIYRILNNSPSLEEDFFEMITQNGEISYAGANGQ